MRAYAAVSDYYDRLQAVRERGQLAERLNFFLVGVKEQAMDAVTRAEALADLRERYRVMLVGDRSRAIEVVDLMFQNPVLVTNRVATSLGTTVQSAMNHLRRLEGNGLFREIPGVAGRSKRWVADEVFEVLEPGGAAQLGRVGP